MFDVSSFETKTRVFKFDHQQMNTFEFVLCLKNDVHQNLVFVQHFPEFFLLLSSNCAILWEHVCIKCFLGKFYNDKDLLLGFVVQSKQQLSWHPRKVFFVRKHTKKIWVEFCHATFIYYAFSGPYFLVTLFCHSDVVSYKFLRSS